MWIGVGRARHVRADLVDDTVGADDLANDLAPATRGRHTENLDARALLAFQGQQGAEELLCGANGIARGLPVDVDLEVVLLVDERQLGAG